MSMRVRLFSRGARWAWRRKSRRWIVFHRRRPTWTFIFSETLEMFSIQAQSEPYALRLAGDAGTISWRESRYWTTFEIRLDSFSSKKQELITGALLRATRYNQDEEESCQK